MEVFRLRETKEFLSIDELREKCETSSSFVRTLEVRADAIHCSAIEIQFFLHSRQQCKAEAAAINIDENLLQLEVTAFPVLGEMLDKMQTIELLWRTAHQFDTCYEVW